jgi:hypothetical protein
MKLMVLIFSVFFIGIMSYGLAYPTRITEYSGASHVGCHGTNNAGTGTLSVGSTVSGRVITLSVTIMGFTEAVTAPYHGTVAIGLPYGYGDNDEFGHGITQNNVHGDDNFWATNIWEENLTAGGNTMHIYTFEVIAPETDGTYDLKVVALTGMNSTGSAAPIYRLEQTLTVTVTGSTAAVASLASAHSFGNIFALILVGLVALGPVVLIITRKRK